MTVIHNAPSADEERELRHLLEEHLDREDWDGVRQAVEAFEVPEIADALHELDHPSRRAAFRALPVRLAAELLSHFSPDRSHRLLEHLEQKQRREVLMHLAPDDRARLFDELPGEKSDELLGLLDLDELEQTQTLLEYPEDSIGRLMTPDCIVLRPGWTVQKALDRVRQQGQDAEVISILFVIDHDDRLVDTISLRKLILADRDSLVEQHLDRRFVALSPTDDRERGVDALSRYDLVAIPVVDDDGAFLGIVTIDDILDVAEQEATEDFHKHGAMTPLERSYSDTSIFSLFKSRVGWLLILVFVNLISAGVIAYFEDTLESIIALAFFIPLLIDSGGNTGAQSATLMVRAIATGDVRLNQWFRAFIKELGVGLTLGVSMGIASAFLGFFRGDFWIGLIVGISMVGIVFVANLVGTLLPFILTRLKIDPAVASSPLITTIADATGLMIYFGTATLFLQAGFIVP